jgi:IS4 transposase
MIIQIYGYRWDIEVFFRFLKQELNFDSIKPYNENGIKVMMYMTLIAAMLILLYKKVNKIEGYKIAKLQFFEDIEKEIIGRIVVDCGGDLGKFKQLYRI